MYNAKGNQPKDQIHIREKPTTDWLLCSNIGIIADIIPDKEQIDYFDRDGNEPLASFGIRWIFGWHKEREPDLAMIERTYFN